MRYFSFLVLACLYPFINTAQETDNTENKIADELDSLYANYLRSQKGTILKIEDLHDSAELIPQFTDSVYEHRLASINSFIPLDYNDITQSFIDVYVARKRYAAPNILALSEMYFPMIEAELDKAGLPLELKYMAVIESALQTQVVSRAGAVGMWQFMYATGKMYKLEISTYIDERKDPRKATIAACQYLKNMYAMYGDWQLSIAAYNCGPGNVNKAIRRSGGKKNFWEIYQYLPRETRGYVPAFIAATYMFNFYNEHNLKPAVLDLTLETDTVMVTKNLHFDDLAKKLEIDADLIRKLNPQYRRNIVPGMPDKAYVLVLPVKHALSYTDHQEEVYSAYITRLNVRASEPVIQKTTDPYDLDGHSKIYYTVKSGDNLGYIADWYDTYVSRIKVWNGMHNNMIKPGQKLVIYVPKSKENFYAAVTNLSFAEKQALDGKPKTQPVAYTEKSSSATNSNAGKVQYINYTVKSGDSVWKIVQKYPGNTVNGVIKLNNISNSRGIMPGDVIKLYPKS